jgi:hypothetical protein
MTPAEPTQNPTLGARLILSGLGLVLVVLGLWFTYLLWYSRQRGEETRQWKETPCEVTASEVLTEKPTPNSPPEYRAFVQYRYELDKSIYHSTAIRRDSGPSTDRGRAEELCAKYKVGLKTTCFVNPMSPGTAVLEHTAVVGPYSSWFTLLFVIGGFGMIFGAWRRRPRPE